MFKKLALAALFVSSTASASESNLAYDVAEEFLLELLAKTVFTATCGFTEDEDMEQLAEFTLMTKEFIGEDEAKKALEEGITRYRRMHNLGEKEKKAKCAVAYLQLPSDLQLATEWMDNL